MATQYQNAINRQQGAALVVSIVVLLVVTLVATAGLNSASMQQKMAANSQQQNETFQAAEGSIAASVTTINGGTNTAGNSAPLHQALSNGKEPATPYKVQNPTLTHPEMDVYSEFIYLSDMNTAAGNSLDADENSNIIPGHRFVIRGQADMASSGARSRIEHGIEYE